MTEGERRRRVEVGHLAGVGEPGSEVGGRLGARPAPHADREPSGRVDAAAEHTGDRVRALLTGKKDDDRRGLLHGTPEGVRPSREQHGDQGSSHVQQGVEQSLLRPGQRQSLDVTSFTAGAPPEEPGAVAEHHQGDVGSARHPGGLIQAGEVTVVDTGAAAIRDLRVRELGGQGGAAR
ncbi:hypothetical protein STENM36S_03373 [Streptomyces tendae]